MFFHNQALYRSIETTKFGRRNIAEIGNENGVSVGRALDLNLQLLQRRLIFDKK